MKLKLKEGFVLREVAGYTVVVPSGDTLDLNMMLSLNGTAGFLWKQLSEMEVTETELVAALLDEYDVTVADAQRDVKQFVEKLNGYGLLE